MRLPFVRYAGPSYVIAESGGKLLDYPNERRRKHDTPAPPILRRGTVCEHDGAAMAVTESLAGRRILITGAGSGIGAVTARVLIDQGARVAIIDRDGGAVRRTAESFEPGTCLGFEGDVVDGAAIER